MKIPIRSMFMAEKGTVLLAIDLSAAEAWVVAFLSGDKNMQEQLKFGDIHKYAASGIFNIASDLITKDQRFVGKKANHMLNYDASYLRFVQSVNMESNKEPFLVLTNKEGDTICKGWHRTFPSIRQWHASVREQLWKDRTIITTYGRKRVYYGPMTDEGFKAMYAHEPQSTIADHCNGRVHPFLGIEGGLLAIHKYITKPSKGEVKLLNQSHDSVLVQCPESTASEIGERIHGYMQRPLIIKGEEFIIPAELEMGTHYGELQKVKMKHPYKI